jgi:dTMP kinase
MPLLVFEGGEGVGKSTHVRLTSRWLQSRGHSVVCTREPGGTALGGRVRSLIRKPPETLTPLSELLLLLAARAQHFAGTIGPALKRGEWVLCDRLYESTYVYQCSIGATDEHLVNAIGRHVSGDVTPSLVVVLEAPYKVIRARLAARQKHSRDARDEAPASYHRKLRAGFRSLVRSQAPYPSGEAPPRVLIDSRHTIERVQKTIEAHVCRLTEA